MKSVVVTLFEGDYHLGAAALINSLHAAGFTGTVVCGYRGVAPPWSGKAESLGQVKVRLVPVETEIHLTNFKPQFLLRTWLEIESDADQMFYFDPDIIIRAPWAFFEEWANCGVALVEDVNSPIPDSHPRRAAWRVCLGRRPKMVRRISSVYVNGGFVGVARKHHGFLHEWLEAMTLVSHEIGGLTHSMFSFAATSLHRESPAYPFNKTDQDALNIAVMTASQPVSIMGSEAMDFKPGGWTMSHALGPDKPWRKKLIRSALQARPPTASDREFWKHTTSPLPVFSPMAVAWRQLTLNLAGAIGRFYRRT